MIDRQGTDLPIRSSVIPPSGIRQHIRFQQPLKHPRYPSKVSVCIAAICQESYIQKIILCSDTRASSGDFGSTDSTNKIHDIIPGWTAQAARRPDSAAELIERVREWFIGSSGLKSIHSVVSLIDAAIREFESSPLYEKNCCELLVTGFIKDKPLIVAVAANEKGKLTVRVVDHFFAIGSGALIATVILNCRGYNNMESLDSALYMVYEAKRLSEKADGVGPYTRLIVTGPDARWPNKGIISDRGREHLESIFTKIGLGSRLSIEKFPRWVILTDPPDPQHPTSDPSGQPPSLE
jgi:hypothetical protein